MPAYVAEVVMAIFAAKLVEWLKKVFVKYVVHSCVLRTVVLVCTQEYWYTLPRKTALCFICKTVI